MRRIPFVVFDIECWTMPALIRVLALVSDEDDATTFLSAYEAVCGAETAEHNLRYMFALVEQEEALRLSELFMLPVPGENEVLSPRHTFGMSSYGVIPEKPLPSYEKPKVKFTSDNVVAGLVIEKDDDEPNMASSRPGKKKKPMGRKMISEAPGLLS